MAVKIPVIPEAERTSVVLMLLEVIEVLKEENQLLKDEIARLTGRNPKPKIEPSRLEKPKPEDSTAVNRKRPGSAKRAKTKELKIHRQIKVPAEDLPAGSTFKGYQPFVVQDLVVEAINTEYLLEKWRTPDDRTLTAKPPVDPWNPHFGTTLKSFALFQHHHCRVTQPTLLEQLRIFGIDISVGELNNILTDNKDAFHQEKAEILEVGLRVSLFVHADDTRARHKGKNGFCTHIGNSLFAWFKSTGSKSRINFLELLRGEHRDYVLNEHALDYMTTQGLPRVHLTKLTALAPAIFVDSDQFQAKLIELDIIVARHIQIVTEGALLGSLIEHGLNPDLIIMSDDAGQFEIFRHVLCWIHAERALRKLIGHSKAQIKALENARAQVWEFYARLKDYREKPTPRKKIALTTEFDAIFTQKTCFTSLNKALERIHSNKSELLMVLERPELPLNNNLSENDIREYVTKRKISGSTRSDAGRDCRDTFISLKKTCRKLGISFWEYLNDRIAGLNTIAPLPQQVAAAAAQIRAP